MDAERYKVYYNIMIEKNANNLPSSRRTKESDFCPYSTAEMIRCLHCTEWTERNQILPAVVRDRLLSLSHTSTIPDPAGLDPVVKVIYELMEEAVLDPFPRRVYTD